MRLMVVIALVINVFLALSLVFFQATRKTYPGFGLWTTGVSMLGLGYLSLCLRGSVPDSVSILVVNAAFPLGMVLQLDGMRRFLGLTLMSRLWYVLPVGVLAAAAVFYYGHDSEGWRTLIVSTAISAPHFAMAFLILRHPVRPRSMFYGVIGSLLALGGVMILGRGIWSLREPQFQIFVDSPVEFIFFVSVVVLQLGETLAFMMLNSERVESELVEAEAELRKTVDVLQKALAEQKRVEESLRDSEEAARSSESFLNNVIDQSPYPMWISDDRGTLIRANKALRDLLQISDEEVVGKYNILRDNIVEEQGVLPLIRNVFDRSNTVRFEIKYDSSQLKHLQLIHSAFLILDVTVFPITDSGGKISNAVIQHMDITERKRAEEALRASEEKYRLLVEKAQEAIFVVQDTVFRFVNPSLEEIVGFSADELIGNSFGSFVHPDDRETVIEKHYRRLKGEVFPSRYEIRIIDKQNRVKWVEIDSVVIDWEGKPAAMVFLTDTSYRKLAEEAAVQTERLKAITDLSGGVAHHFNNLLQIVIGNTSLSLADLESGDLSEVKTNLEQMLEAATLGAETVRRLQTFANIRADITKEEAAIFDIAATARSAAEVSEPLWKSDPEKERIKIDLHLDLEDGCLVKGQKNEMFEVLVNLIINAAEAMPDCGDIEVKTHREADEVLITVQDTGSGIAEEDLPKVFQPFWSSKGVGIGKGMGLAVTHGLVKRHGGTINVQSKVGNGTTFTIRLPLAQEPIRKTAEPATRPAERKLSILVIEDDQRIATLLEMIFVDAGHSAFKALSGGEGLAIFNKEPVDLVICDLGMPGMNGWDVGKAIRSVCQEKGITKPPFVLLTGWGGQELEREKIVESGTDAVVAKPIDSAALLATIQDIAARFNSKSHET